MKYSVCFNPKYKKMCAFDFTVEANTAEEATRKAQRGLRDVGEYYANYKKPKVRVVQPETA